MKPALIYTLRCPESGAVRYVGKCVNLQARLRQHNSEARIGQVKSHKCDWIRSLHARGLKPVMILDATVEAGADWKAVEVARVAHYRALGCNLTNGTPGGDEAGELTEEGRGLLAASASARFGTPEGRKAQAELMSALCQSPEWRAARDAAAKATRATPEYKARMSARAKSKWADPEYRDRMRQARAEVCARPEYRKKMSAATSKTMADPAVRARQAESVRAIWADGRRR